MPVDRTAYFEGEKAYRNDKPIHRNPFEADGWQKRQGWLDGWLDSQRDFTVRNLGKPKERRIKR